MKYLVIFVFSVLLLSCGALKQSYQETRPKDCWELLGKYDTSMVVHGGFMKGKQTIICFSDRTGVVIWGKKCDIPKNETLYAKSVWYYSPGFGGGRWKYFLVNDDESIHYTLIDP